MRKPDFFIVGAGKAGTTSLYRYARQHPYIFLPKCKEPRFFVDDDFFSGVPPALSRHVRSLDEYLALFAPAPEHVVAGDASPNYLSSPTAAARIHEFRPDALIVAILRDPADRAYSHYCNHRRAGIEALSFEAAIAAETQRPPRFHYVEEGLYASHLLRYLDLFGEDSVAVFFTEDLRHDPAALCRRLFSFLHVDTSAHIDVSTIHNQASVPRWLGLTLFYRSIVSGDSLSHRIARRVAESSVGRAARWTARRSMRTRRIPPMLEETRQQLVNRYRKDVRELERLTRRDLSHWLR